MVELTPIEQAVVKAMEELGATKDTGIKSADAIASKANRPKGLVGNALVNLVGHNLIKRVIRDKASGYYLLKK
jgi:predicted transcriptional regulator